MLNCALLHPLNSIHSSSLSRVSDMKSDTPFSDCSITNLLPRTFGSSFTAGAALSESDDVDYISSLFNSTALKKSAQLLEHAKMISNSNCSSIPTASLEDGNYILGKRSQEVQIELQGKRARQRRPGLPGLPGVDRGKLVFNFSAKTTTAEVSQMGTSDDFPKRSCCVESNIQSWPVIDYSCLERISDPIEYFSTYRMLENAEKEIRKLKGEVSPKLSQPQRRRDRQRRPGLPGLEEKKNEFKFPVMLGTVEDYHIEKPTQSNDVNITELTIASGSKEINQIKNSQTVTPESKLAGNAETFDSNVDKEYDELEWLLSKCKGLDNDGIANFVRESLKINPIHVEKSRGFPFSIPSEYKFESSKLSHILSIANRNKIDGLQKFKERLSLIIPQGDPCFPHQNDREKKSDGSTELGSNCNVFSGDGLEKLSSSKGIMLKEKHKPNCNDIRVDGTAELEQETWKAKLPDAEITNAVDPLSALKKSIPSIDIQARLAEISALKRKMLQNTTDVELPMFSYADLEDSSLSKSQEMLSISPGDVLHLDVGSKDAQNASIPGLSYLKRLSFEDKMHAPVAENSEEDKNLGKEKISDPIGSQFILLEDTCQRPNGTISNEEFASIVSGTNLEEAGQSSDSVYLRPTESLPNRSSEKLHEPLVITDASEQILHSEDPNDDSLPENFSLIDEQLEAPFKDLNGRNKNQGRTEASGGSTNRELEREEPTCRRRRQNSILRRKSLAGAGSAWESGVRRSTRIRMKPLKYWCGERFLYARIHDSLATVIGVKKFETTPQNGRKTVMKVQSYVSDQHADLVAQAALY